MFLKIIPQTMFIILFVISFISMALTGQDEQIKIFPGMYQRIHHSISMTGMYILIHFTGHEQ